jgi:hypothetical protein
MDEKEPESWYDLSDELRKVTCTKCLKIFLEHELFARGVRGGGTCAACLQVAYDRQRRYNKWYNRANRVRLAAYQRERKRRAVAGRIFAAEVHFNEVPGREDPVTAFDLEVEEENRRIAERREEAKRLKKEYKMKWEAAMQRREEALGRAMTLSEIQEAWASVREELGEAPKDV